MLLPDLDLHDLVAASELDHRGNTSESIQEHSKRTSKVGSFLPRRTVGKTPGNVAKGVRGGQQNMK